MRAAPVAFDPWWTLGVTERLDAIELAAKRARKAQTWEERRAATALIRGLASGIEDHLTRFTPDGWPRAPRMPPCRPPRSTPPINEDR